VTGFDTRGAAGARAAAAVAFLSSATGLVSQPQRERVHWDAVARAMPDLSGARSTACYRVCEQALVARALAPQPGEWLLKLDLWNEAVNTRLLQWLDDGGVRVTGIDLSAVTTTRARDNFIREGRTPTFAQADIRALPFPSDSVDAVYTMGTIEHIAEYRQALAEVHRVLRPGGRALIGVPHRWDIFGRPLIAWMLQRLGRYPYSPERSFGAGELRAVIEDAGLRVTTRTGLLFVPGLLRLTDLALHVRRHRLERLTAALVAPFERAELRWEWSRRLGYLLAVVAHKP
jgi:SAM-dependent methyltransferase